MSDKTSRGGEVRVRFAPSPTGNIHLGGARTALFNWLFARHHMGRFILRIEDTDRQRSRKEFVREIIESLEWLGICRDEGPYFQSRRRDIYRQSAKDLLKEDRAYYCFCQPEELEKRRKAASLGQEAFGYDGRCAGLSREDQERKLEKGIKAAVRLRVPVGQTAWEDLVRGRITFDNDHLDDFVILKGDGAPTYHFAAVVDDIDMGITHVIRGEDHISNTPKQLIIYEALDCPPPAMAHIPLIHGRDGARLSKRHGAMSVIEYQRMGIISEGMVNYLALLGWSAGDDRELFDVGELISLFDLERVVRTAAVFDLEKLKWINRQHLSKMSLARRTNYLLPYWIEAGFLRSGDEGSKRAWLEDVVAAVGDRLKLLSDIVPLTDFFFLPRVSPDRDALKVLKKARARPEAFRKVGRRLESLDHFKRDDIEEVIRGVIEEEALSTNQVVQPLRAAISGRLATPGLFESMELLGKEKTMDRLREHLLDAPAAS